MVGGWFPRRVRNTNRNKLNIRFFRYDTLRIATDNFSTLLGSGGFGSIFKGVLPDNGRTVAIKKFTKPYEGFLKMVEFMSQLRHVNLIQVIGCCVDNGEQLLVCEFAENGCVLERLHGKDFPALDWKTRASVCAGTARGLSYLHEDINPGIIHCDVKPANIVLDANFVPKIADFDLIRYLVDGCIYAESDTENAHDLGMEYSFTHREHPTSCLRGTMGYMDPYYLQTGVSTEKMDVYSFGVTMLQIITGRKPVDMSQGRIDDRVTLHWVIREREDGTVLKIVDPKLTDFPEDDVERFINVALLCTQATPEQRPSMFEVVHMLHGRHKSDREISEMATRAIADQPAGWSIGDFDDHTPDRWSGSAYDNHTPASNCSLTMSLDGRGGIIPLVTDHAAEMESREEPFDETGSHGEGECSASEAALAPVETRLVISSQEDQVRPVGPKDVVKAYFERSMEKIMRYQDAKRRNISDRTTVMTHTIVMKKFSGNLFSEAVYPPFLTGEYRSSRFLYSGRPAPL